MKSRFSTESLTILLVLLVLTFVAGGAAIGVFVGRATNNAAPVTITAASTSPAATTPAATAAASTSPVSPAVAAGAHDFIQFGCYSCHGELGKGDVSPDVPGLTAAGGLTVAKLTSIIEHGLGSSSNPTKPYMPVWKGVISNTQISDLVAYIQAGLPAVADAVPPPVPAGQGDVVKGAALFQSYGCINCHGPNGLGGVPNPAAPDKVIPPLAGSDFRSEFNTDKKIIDFINSGSVLGGPAIVSMPHWGGIIPDPDLQALLAYLKTLAP